MKSLSLIIFVSILLNGCASKGDLENCQRENQGLRYEIQINQGEILKSQKTLECLQRYNAAFNGCQALFQGEPNGIVLQQQIRQCLTNQGFRDGQATCNNLR